MIQQKNYKFWFCTGSQDLYGDECLAHVAEHAKIIVNALNASGNLPYEVVWKPTLITNALIRQTFNEAMKTVPVSSRGCIHSRLQNHGSLVCRSTENRCFTCTHSSTVRFHMIRSTWIS